VRTEGIITQLVFEHSMRIRMKSESTSTQPSAASSTQVSEVQSIVEDSPNDENDGETAVTVGESETLAENGTSSVPSISTLSEEKQEKENGNLIGKINNLVTTDLDNIVAGRDLLGFLSNFFCLLFCH